MAHTGLIGGLDFTSTHDDVTPHYVIPVIETPRELKAAVSIWTHISSNDMDSLDCAHTADEVKCELIRIFVLDDHADNSRSAVLLDLYFYAVQFARESGFSKEQCASFISMISQVHNACVATPFNNLDDSFRFFRDLVLCHSVQRPPFSVQLFSLDEARCVLEYVTNSYFRHYKLYKYVFTPAISLDLAICYPGLPDLPSEDVEADGGAAPGTEEEQKEEEQNENDGEEEEEEEEKEETEAEIMLRSLVRDYVEEEMGRLRFCLDEQIKLSTKDISDKLAEAEKQSEKVEHPAPAVKKKGGKGK